MMIGKENDGWRMNNDGHQGVPPGLPREDEPLEQVTVLLAKNGPPGITSATASHSALIPALPRVASIH